MIFKIINIFNRVKKKSSRNDFLILTIADCCEPLTDEKLKIIENEKFDFCILIGHITKANLAKLAPVIEKIPTLYILGSHSNPEAYKKYNFQKLTPEEACFLNFETGWISIAGSSYPQSDEIEDESEENYKTLFSDIFVCNDYPGTLYEKTADLKQAEIKQNISFHKPELCIYHQLGESEKRRFLTDDDCEITAIGVHCCAVINYHSFKIKDLF